MRVNFCNCLYMMLSVDNSCSLNADNLQEKMEQLLKKYNTSVCIKNHDARLVWFFIS